MVTSPPCKRVDLQVNLNSLLIVFIVINTISSGAVFALVFLYFIHGNRFLDMLHIGPLSNYLTTLKCSLLVAFLQGFKHISCRQNSRHIQHDDT